MHRHIGNTGAHRSGHLNSCLPALLISALAVFGLASPAEAGFTAKDAQVMGRVLGFLDQAPPANVTLAIVYEGGSKGAADALAGQINGLKAGNFTLSAKVMSSGEVAGSNADAILLMNGAGSVANVVKSKKIPCFTGDDSLVRNGGCLISIRTDPKVEILVNGALSKSSGISFGAAFRMMITEI